MFEHGSEPLLPRRAFLQRLARHFSWSLAIIAVSLALGIAGYHVTEHLGWVDAYLNATMLLGGMGPVNAPQSVAGKRFAGTFALYAGLVFIAVTGLLAAPVLHRIMHRLHVHDSEAEACEDDPDDTTR